MNPTGDPTMVIDGEPKGEEERGSIGKFRTRGNS